MKHNKIIIETLSIILVSHFIFTTVSCSHSEGSSFISSLDEIDIYIKAGETGTAAKHLKKLEKTASSDFDNLSIYKRYTKLGEKKSAERILIKGLKKNKNSMELSAVYTNFLLRQNRLEEALKTGEILKNSKYSSIYAECFLRDAFVRNAESENKKSIFSDPTYVDIYTKAYGGTNDPLWIINAASILMAMGNYNDAALLFPERISTFEEAYFWGCVFFDNSSYTESLETLRMSNNLAELGDKDNSYIKSEILLLESDDYYITEDENNSELCRDLILEKDNPNFDKRKVLLNSALYSRKYGNYTKEYNKLQEMFYLYPDYEPGLACYARSALENMKLPKEDIYKTELRKSGLRTTEMEKSDAIPRITYEEAVAHINEQSDTAEKDILLEKIYNEYTRITSKEEKNYSVRLWELLERHTQNGNIPPDCLSQYVAVSLIEHNYIPDAEGVFNSHLAEKYQFEEKYEFDNMELWELELMGFFACKNSDYIKGMKVYDYILEQYGTKSTSLLSYSANLAIINACVNMSVLYSSTDDLDKAMEALLAAGGKICSPEIKAEILYRTAALQVFKGETKNAIRSLQYAVSLDKTHKKARLLLKKIRTKS